MEQRHMWRFTRTLLQNLSPKTPTRSFSTSLFSESNYRKHEQQQKQRLLWLIFTRDISGSASCPSFSIWRRKKEMSKEGLIAAKELKRLQSHPVRLDRFIKSSVSRLLKSDLVAVLAEFQRQDQVFLCMKVRF